MIEVSIEKTFIYTKHKKNTLKAIAFSMFLIFQEDYARET